MVVDHAVKATGTATEVDTRLAAIILAAGKGVRMRSEKAKVLHLLRGVPLVRYPLRMAQEIGSCRVVVVVGHQAEEVKDAFQAGEVEFAEQRERLGSGHAVLQTRSLLEGFPGEIVILSGDVPLLRAETLRELIRSHRRQKTVLSFLTSVLPDPGGYGRVVRTEDSRVIRVVEEKDATLEERAIREINGGIYCIRQDFLYPSLGKIGWENEQGEYYLTGLVEIAFSGGLDVIGHQVADPRELMGVNTPEELAWLEMFLREELRSGKNL